MTVTLPLAIYSNSEIVSATLVLTPATQGRSIPRRTWAPLPIRVILKFSFGHGDRNVRCFFLLSNFSFFLICIPIQDIFAFLLPVVSISTFALVVIEFYISSHNKLTAYVWLTDFHIYFRIYKLHYVPFHVPLKVDFTLRHSAF